MEEFVTLASTATMVPGPRVGAGVGGGGLITTQNSGSTLFPSILVVVGDTLLRFRFDSDSSSSGGGG